MDAKQLLILGASMIASSLADRSLAQETAAPYVQIAELEIDPAQLESYKSEVRQQIETATRVEPGVLVLYAVSHRDDPARVTVFEVYASTAAYRAHIESPHFKRYKSATDKMVRSLKLIPASPIMLGDKPT